MADNVADNVMHRTDTWDRVAEDYEALAEPFTRRFAERALAFAGGVAPGERVLDVAAGTGALTLLAGRAGARVLATDFAPGMVARLRHRLAAEGLDRSGCEARVMDGQALGLPEGAFDAAFSMFGVVLFPDHRRGLAEMARVLRPGGRAVVATWASPEGAGPALMLKEAMRAIFPDRSFPAPTSGLARFASPGALAEGLREAGFHGAEVAVETVAYSWTAPSADEVVGDGERLFRMMPLYAALDPADRERVHHTLRDILRGRFGDGPVEVPAEAHIAVGRR